jgi:hypothetical protein
MTQVLPDEVKNRCFGPWPPTGIREHPEATVRLPSQDRSKNCLRFMGMDGTLDPHGQLVEKLDGSALEASRRRTVNLSCWIVRS